MRYLAVLLLSLFSLSCHGQSLRSQKKSVEVSESGRKLYDEDSGGEYASDSKEKMLEDKEYVKDLTDNEWLMSGYGPWALNLYQEFFGPARLEWDCQW